MKKCRCDVQCLLQLHHVQRNKVLLTVLSIFQCICQDAKHCVLVSMLDPFFTVYLERKKVKI